MIIVFVFAPNIQWAVIRKVSGPLRTSFRFGGRASVSVGTVVRLQRCRGVPIVTVVIFIVVVKRMI